MASLIDYWAIYHQVYRDCLIKSGFLLLWHYSRTKSSLRWKELISIYNSQVTITEGDRGRNSKQEPRSRSWRRGHWRSAAYCLAPPDLPGLLSYSTLHHQPRGDTAFPHQSSIKKIPHKPILWRHFLNWVLLFPDNSSLCHDNIKLTNISDSFCLHKLGAFDSYPGCPEIPRVKVGMERHWGRQVTLTINSLSSQEGANRLKCSHNPTKAAMYRLRARLCLEESEMQVAFPSCQAK